MKEGRNRNRQGTDEDTLTEGPGCPRGEVCGDGSESDLCKVTRFSSHADLLQCLDDKHCQSKLQFADIYFCTCPVRSEIFRKGKGKG
jgi:hypothetical protein